MCIVTVMSVKEGIGWGGHKKKPSQNIMAIRNRSWCHGSRIKLMPCHQLSWYQLKRVVENKNKKQNRAVQLNFQGDRASSWCYIMLLESERMHFWEYNQDQKWAVLLDFQGDHAWSWCKLVDANDIKSIPWQDSGRVSKIKSTRKRTQARPLYLHHNFTTKLQIIKVCIS